MLRRTVVSLISLCIRDFPQVTASLLLNQTFFLRRKLHQMKRLLLLTFLGLVFNFQLRAQEIVTAATKFINTLSNEQKAEALYPFESEERYNFHFFPISDRKGITMDKLSESQQQDAIDMMKACLSEQTVNKAKEIMQLEVVLKALENRKPDDHYRDPGKYYIAIFGVPGANTVWGWRFEGHHVSFNFSVDKKTLVSGTPGFLGANPAIVPDGPQKGKQVLKDETNLGFALLHSLSNDQLKKAVINATAPGDILTFNHRKASLDSLLGISYGEMTSQQQQQFLQLINLYVHRYTKIFADQMLKEIQQAGLNNLLFAWAGFQEPGLGKPHYYRIQGPTIIIEYDNTQNNANHVHSVVRDLKRDYGGDLLLEHYKASHQ